MDSVLEDQTPPTPDGLLTLAAAATPLPWSEFCESGDWWIEHCDTDGNPTGGVVCDADAMSSADMLYIVAAANQAPQLARENAALRAVLEDILTRYHLDYDTLEVARAALAAGGE